MNQLKIFSPRLVIQQATWSYGYMFTAQISFYRHIEKIISLAPELDRNYISLMVKILYLFANCPFYICAVSIIILRRESLTSMWIGTFLAPEAGALKKWPNRSTRSIWWWIIMYCFWVMNFFYCHQYIFTHLLNPKPRESG